MRHTHRHVGPPPWSAALDAVPAGRLRRQTRAARDTAVPDDGAAAPKAGGGSALGFDSSEEEELATPRAPRASSGSDEESDNDDDVENESDLWSVTDSDD